MSTTYGATGLGQTASIDAARLQLFQELLGCVSGMAETPEVTSQLCDLSDRELMDIGTRAARSSTSPRTALSIREASEPPNERRGNFGNRAAAPACGIGIEVARHLHDRERRQGHAQ